MADLPEELLVDILLWLPVESLVRFKCVCKSWYALFKNPEFVSKHMVNQSKKDIILSWDSAKDDIFSWDPPYDAPLVFYFLSIIEHGGGGDVSCIVDLNLDIRSPYPPTHYSRGLSIVGHCDGLIALSDFDEEVILCNPATKEVRTLPKSSFHPFPRNPLGIYPLTGVMHAEIACVGFGYDSKSKDYKVVRVVDFCPDASWYGDIHAKVEVFSIYGDSTWREINNAVVSEGGVSLCWHMEQYLDGVYYWCTRQEMLSFDMGDEVFRKAPMPDFCCCSLLEEWHSGLFNNECIALFGYHDEGFETCIDVWTMKEFGCWNKQLTIGPLSGLRFPLLVWNNGKELIQEDANGQLVSYDLVTLKSKNPLIHTPRSSSNIWQAFPYMKTLVSVNRREDFLIDLDHCSNQIAYLFNVVFFFVFPCQLVLGLLLGGAGISIMFLLLGKSIIHG